MSVLSGSLRKMESALNGVVDYTMVVGEHRISLKEHFNQPVRLAFSGNIYCVQCGRKTSKSFQQGHCFPCMRKINECNNCILHPERCLVEKGCCPLDDWAHVQCDKPHIVYLANTSGLKVGVTRETQVPTRWIDQGAMQALPIYRTQNRYQAGIIEVAFKSAVADKTNWRTMLKQDAINMDLLAERDRLQREVMSSIAPILEKYPDSIELLDETPVVLKFPVSSYPEKISSLSLDKTPEVSGTLLGIKGQYWLMDTGVMNIRKFSGYDIEWQAG